MNSPTHFTAPNFSGSHESRYMPKTNQVGNFFVPRSPALVQHQSMGSHPTSYNAMPKVQNFNSIPDFKGKFNEAEKMDRTALNKSNEVKYFQTQPPRTSDLSQCSIKEALEANVHEELRSKIGAIGNHISTIMAKLAEHDQKIKEVMGKQKTDIIDLEAAVSSSKMRALISDVFERQIGESQQHFTLQNRLVKADIDTLKLEMMCFADKKELKDINDKAEASQKRISQLIKEVQRGLKEETEAILEKRKKDLARFEKEIEDMRIKMMNIVFNEETREAKDRVCLVKCLSFKVLHEMRVYDEEHLRWLELGTGETVYGIDQEGYLLDNENKYITSPQGALVKLEPAQIEMLKKHGLTR